MKNLKNKSNRTDAIHRVSTDSKIKNIPTIATVQTRLGASVQTLQCNVSTTFHGFTLVELIVVITILAILGTIGFMSFQSYSSSARDSVRISDIKSLSKGLEIYKIKTGVVPLPENISSTGVIGPITLTYVGEIGSSISKTINVSKTPTDPLLNTPYIYGTTWNKTSYQIATILENPISYNNINIINQTYASSNNYQARVEGNYKGYIKYSSGSEVWLANIPSIIFNNTGTINLLSTGTYFVVSNKSNLPYRPTPTTPIQNQDANTLIQSIVNQSNATLTGVNITNITTSTGISGIFTGALLTSFGGNINVVTNIITGDNAVATTNNQTQSETTCTSWSYSTGACQPGNFWTLTVLTSLPSGCTGGTPASTGSCIYIPQSWTEIDTNCTKPNITIGSQIWAGCNSTLGSMNTSGVNQYTGICYNYAGTNAYTTACQSSLAKENWSGITTDVADEEYAPTQTDNIYGKLYRFDTDIKATGKCNTKTIGGQSVYGGGADCPCPEGWHIPSDSEFQNLENTLGCPTGDLTRNGAWGCNGLGWKNQNTKNSTNNIIKALGLPLAGYCDGGSCSNRGIGSYYWASTESGASAWTRGFHYSGDSVSRNALSQADSFSVRCAKDY